MEDIFLSLHEIFITAHQRKVSCDWKYEDDLLCLTPTLTIQSVIRPSRLYRFRIHFPKNFPKNPPSIEPIDLLPAVSHFAITHHPMLTTKYWSAEQSLSDIFEQIVQSLDLLPDPIPLPALTIGDKQKTPLEHLKQLICDFYGLYKEEMKGYKRLEETLLSFYPKDFCMF